MTDPMLPALIVFAGMFAIAVIGLMMSNSAATRLHKSHPRSNHTAAGHKDTTQFYDGARR